MLTLKRAKPLCLKSRRMPYGRPVRKASAAFAIKFSILYAFIKEQQLYRILCDILQKKTQGKNRNKNILLTSS